MNIASNKPRQQQQFYMRATSHRIPVGAARPLIGKVLESQRGCAACVWEFKGEKEHASLQRVGNHSRPWTRNSRGTSMVNLKDAEHKFGCAGIEN
ncbi:hypothetical protein EVAR_68600_1 [Eumeta japonica]|uniref:Uncharacterized protein n=1 Tax=Eumeta variegata TaxID=151549 RepID=A0A4C1ZL04_EUMVA|nr:hypothetical protein EVAR_68600_1 [Eumeta japonica]